MGDKYTLKFPVKYKGHEIDHVVINRPKVKDIKKAQEYDNDFESAIVFVSQCTTTDRGAIEELDKEDFDEISKIVMGSVGE